MLIGYLSHGQFSSQNPFHKDFISSEEVSSGVRGAHAKSQKAKQPTLAEIEADFKAYWKDKDHTKKGSGYKPFMRWAHHWQDYLLEDGTIAPPAVLWQAWERKQEAESKQNSFGVPDDNILNWTNLGPSVVTNSSVSISGQGRVNTITLDPNNPQTLHVGAPAGGIWKSTDDGANWIPLSDNLPQIGVSGIAIDPTDSNIIYIATGDDDAGDSYSVGVLKSLDGGQTWDTTGLQYEWTNFETTNEIYIDPTNNKHIWVASSEGLQKSEDGGNTWSVKQAGDIVDFKFHPKYTTNSIIYAVGYNENKSKFYRSSDKGENFTAIESIPNNSNRIVLETTPAAVDNVYVLTAYDNGDGTYEGRNSFQGVYVSNDAGLNFVKTEESDDIFGSAQSWYDMALTVSDTDPDVVFVGVLDIWKSTDGGDDFTQINAWYQRTSAFTHADIHFLRYFNGILYAGTDGGIYRSADDGDNFEDLSNTLSIAQIYTVSTSRPNSSKLASGLQDCGGFALSESKWNSYHGGDGMGSAVDPFNEDVYYGMTQYGGSLHRTTTGGNGGWSNNEFITVGPVDGEWVTPMEFAKNGDLYAGYDQLYVLEANQWVKRSNHNFGGENLRTIKIDPNNIDIVYVATTTNIYKSVNGGVTFMRLQLQSSNLSKSAHYPIKDIEIDITNSNNLWVLDSFYLYSSTDQGDSFESLRIWMFLTPTTVSTILEAATSLKHQPYSPNNSLYIGTLLGVYYTDDDLIYTIDDTPNQRVWESISSDLPNVKVSDMEINPYDNILTVSTYGRGIWQTPIPTITRPSIDIDLIRINTEIESDYRCDNILTANFEVYNNGTSAIASFSYEMILNDLSEGTSNWTGNIAPGELKVVPFEIPKVLEAGQNTITVDLTHPSETLTANNLVNIVFVVNDPPNLVGQNNFRYVFESEENDWLTVGDPVWEKGTPAGTSLNQVNSGTAVYGTNLDGNHPNDATSSLVSPCFDLSGLGSGTIRFYLAYELETSYDYLNFQYSTDSGLNWSTIDSYNGFDSELKEYTYSVNQSMLSENVIFRFHLIADAYVNEEGAIIDDFIIDGVSLHTENDIDLDIAIYPNPTTGRFIIDTKGLYQLESVKIYSIDGKQVYDKNFFIEHSKKGIDLSNITKGLYFVEIISKNKGKMIRKLVLK
ncbi:MAG: T9SS type A sorting domain-containing protein [Flavobacteriaceae bacterium]|nr:T9SS type A sorting domain-containing protein [Flavobacteriaceae bacterium]